MPAKLSNGEKLSTPKLNDVVNRLTDGEFADFLALDGEGGAEFGYRKLAIWHRGKCPYDPKQEKAAFAAYDIYSLRKQTFKKLENGLRELRSALPRALAGEQDAMAGYFIDDLIHLLGRIEGFKAHAIERGYFESLQRILELEESVVKRLPAGANRDAALEHVQQEARQARASMELSLEVERYRTDYLEAVRQQFYATGAIDQERVAAYFASDFAKLDITGYPAKLSCAKLLIDEFFLSITRSNTQAANCAESAHRLHQEFQVLTPLEHAKLLTRLSFHAMRLNSPELASKAISYFEVAEPESEPNRKIYLKKYVVALFDQIFENDGLQIATKAIEVFERNAAEIISSEADTDRIGILIFAMSYYLGVHEGIKAKRIFDLLYRAKDQKPPLQYRIQYMLSHLMILFELKDHAGMQSFGKNYREFLVEHLPVSAPAIEVLGFLKHNLRAPKATKQVSRDERKLQLQKVQKFNQDIDTLTDKLKRFQDSGVTSRSLWYSLIYWWLEGIRLKLIDD